MRNEFTIGIEEEYQVIDPKSKELISHEQKIVEMAGNYLSDQVKAEMHQAVVEVGTKVCTNVTEAFEQICYLRKSVSEIAGNLGYRIGASGTHPFSAWQNQMITPHPRYDEIIMELQDTARSNLIFGLHVHVGILDRHLALHIANSLRYFLPHIFALSTNSPFWEGRNTGFKSFRTKIFDKFPRTGIPDAFESLSEYDDYISLLIKTRCIDNSKKIWWDLRVHPFYPTVEVRICDIPLTVKETIAITALIQSLAAKLYKLRMANMSWINYRRPMINENKWRASRFGLDGKLIDFGKEEEINTKELIFEILDFVDDVVDELGNRWALDLIPQMMENGTGADRQLKVYEETKDLKKVVDFIMDETLRDT